MAIVLKQKEPTSSTIIPQQPNLADRVRELERRKTLAERVIITEEESKPFRFPRKWLSGFRKSKKKQFDDKMLVIYFNKKNQIETPKFMPIFDGNMIVWKNKPYEFDPRAIWSIKGVKGNPQVYCIREIDRRPIRNLDGSWKRDKYGRPVYSSDSAISNLDIESVRARGDSTESDEFLIKAALKAQTMQAKKPMNMTIIIVVAILAAIALGWYLIKG